MTILDQNKKMFSELDEFLELLTEDERNAIPAEIRQFLKLEKDTNYTKKIDINKPISEQNLMPETLSAIAVLNLKYWCKDEDEKKLLKRIYFENEMQYQELLRKKYNPNNIFSNEIKNKKEESAITEITAKGNFFEKIFNKIKIFFKIY